jgi:glycosyltransferase involved in cell wall biosynthesis
LTAIKQHSLFLDMAARVAARSDRVLFLVVGDGELRAPLEGQAVRLGIGARVRFLGWRGDLDRIYGATDVFVLTSRNEGTPVALIEAMAAGVASVSTQVGGVVDVITNTEVGRLVPFGDPDRLAAAVSALADSPTDRAHMGRLARASVRQRFDLRRLVDDIGALYRQLLQPRPSPYNRRDA